MTAGALNSAIHRLFPLLSAPSSFQDLRSLLTNRSSDEVVAKKRVPRGAAAKSTPPGSSADGDFDVLVMVLWNKHLEEIGRSFV